jgi:hypothetical protein
LLEPGALLAELLRLLRRTPNFGILEFEAYFLQSLALFVVLKDTPSKNRFVLLDL